MKRISILFLLCLGILGTAVAQREETVFGRSGLRLSGAWGGSSLQLSAFDGDYALLSGGHGGLEFNKSIFLGWGGYNLVDEVRFADLPTQNLDFSFNGPILGVSLKPHRIIHPRVSLMAGSGEARFRGEPGRDRLFVIQPSGGVAVNVFRWFHLAVEVGYRFVDGTELSGLEDRDLSAAFGQLRFQFGWSWGGNRVDIDF
ncbi:MAG: hypothetical protein AAFW73_08690 [Bacteroidota bacterium]